MANKVYYAQETVKSFKSSGGDAVITLTSLANAAGRISAVLDLGAGSKSGEYVWAMRTRVAVAPTVGAAVRVYLATGLDGTWETGDFTAGDGAVSSEDLMKNLTLVGSVIADEASTTKDFVRNGLLYIRARYIRVAIWNDMGQALSSTATDHEFFLFPVPTEIQ